MLLVGAYFSNQVRHASLQPLHCLWLDAHPYQHLYVIQALDYAVDTLWTTRNKGVSTFAGVMAAR